MQTRLGERTGWKQIQSVLDAIRQQARFVAMHGAAWRQLAAWPAPSR
jgi:hypothetical protein